MPEAVTKGRIMRDLRALGVPAGGVVMVHARVSALGWVVGGSGTVVEALLEVLGPDGTLAAYAGWEEHVFRIDERPPEHRAAYLEEPPAFDLATSEAMRENGRLPERIRTWPGAERSPNPDASIVAVGSRARWLTAEHPDDDGYGPRSPLGRLVEAGGHVLMLGAPLDTVTLLHHAEAIARVPGKRRVAYRLLVHEAGAIHERAYEDIDTSADVLPYPDLRLPDDPFVTIARESLAAGIGHHGHVAAADCHLFPARELTTFATAWLERHFAASA